MQNILKSEIESENQAGSRSWPEHPYRGLNFFTAGDSPLFGEREEEIDDCFRLVGKIRTRMLLLHGRSGTGKSSFLRAGLLPELKKQDMGVTLPAPESESEALVIRCTYDPVSRIATILGDLVGKAPIAQRVGLKDQREIKRLLTFEAEESRTLLADRIVRALAMITPKFDRPLLLVIDQSEEVLSLPDRLDIKTKEGFFALLEELCWKTRIGVKIILSLRTEYYGQFCDHFKLEPQTKLSPGESGVQQYMLHGISEPGRLSSAILRPTRTEEIEGLGSARSFYKFSFAEGLPGRIASDLLVHCGESSTLPVMQIVCTQLFERMRDRGDSVISMGDYLQIGLVAGALDAFVDSRIRSSIKDSGEIATEQNVRQWRETLGSLVAKQEGGAVTTLIVSKAKLVEIAKECGLQRAIGTTINNMARERCRLLRPVATLPSGLFRPRREYSLGHDALAIALFRWAEAHETIIEAKRESRIRVRRLQIVGWVIAAISCLALFQLVSQRAGTFTTLLAFGEADQAGSYGQRLKLFSASLDQANGLARLFLDYEKPIKALKDTLERAPIKGGEGEAVGFSPDGASLILLNGERAIVIPIGPRATLDPGKPNEFKFDEVASVQKDEGGAPPPSNLPLTSAIGFVDGLATPVVYKNGRLYYWVGQQPRSVILTKLVPKSFLDSPLPLGIDMSGGVIRIWPWRFGANDMDYILIRAANDRSEDDIFVASEPKKVVWRSLFAPVASQHSPEAASIDREPNPEKPNDPHFAVKRINFSEASTAPLGVISDAPPQDGQRGGSPEFVRSLAFPVNAGGVVARAERQQFEYFTGQKNEHLTFPIVDVMQTDPRRPSFFSLRPLLAAQQSVTDRKKWRFAWLGESGIYVMGFDGGNQHAGPVSWPPLLAGEFGVENARALAFSPDGNALTLLTQKGFREPVKYRIYNLTEARRTEIGAMDVPALRSEACRVAKTEYVLRPPADTRPFFRTFSCE